MSFNMKKSSIILIAFSVLISCKSKKNATVTSNTNPTEEHLTAAKKKYPDADMATLNQGHNLYYGAACTRCHPANDLNFQPIDGLPGIIERMAKKAKITPEEKDAVLKYVMGVKLAAVR